MESETSTYERAIEAWNAPEAAPAPETAPAAPVTDAKAAAPESKPSLGEAKAAEPAAAKPAAPETQPEKKPEGDAKPAEGAPKPETAPAAELQRFQELLQEGERAITFEQLKNQVADARYFYDILEGKIEPATLLEFLQQNYPPVFQKIVRTVAEGLGVQASNPASSQAPSQAPNKAGEASEKAGDKAAEPNPLERKVGELEQWRQQQEAQQRQQETARQRMKAVESLQKKVGELAQAQGLEAEERAEFEHYISARIGTDPEARERLEKGNLVDIEKLFTERSNALEAMFQRRSERLLKSKQDRERSIPKIPAGGAPPAPATVQRPDYSTAEGRISAAMEQWKQSGQ